MPTEFGKKALEVADELAPARGCQRHVRVLGDATREQELAVSVWVMLVWHTKKSTSPIGGPPTTFPTTFTKSVTEPAGPSVTVAEEMNEVEVDEAGITSVHSLGSRSALLVLSADPVYGEVPP